ncbi:hypothetical protein K435DRAFT_578368, partial [Dendrothele bispora CBS 962.96]
TAHESQLRQALIECNVRDEGWKGEMIKMQAGVVLANIYSRQVQCQLQAHEEKSTKKGKSRLIGDGKACFFTGDEFFNAVVEDNERREEEAEKKKKAQEARLAHVEALQQWESRCNLIRERNQERKERFHADEAAWK